MSQFPGLAQVANTFSISGARADPTIESNLLVFQPGKGPERGSDLLKVTRFLVELRPGLSFKTVHHRKGSGDRFK